MPVFHTKTIESILEPIAQQISKLVILHEEADDGNSMPDLSLPLQVVRQAADNLIRVGRQTCETTEDSLLQKELPQALNQVKNACEALETASINLKSDSKSATGKRKLVEGERGILQGISAILLTLDESQVRKIVNSCKQVIEYLSITELIDKTDDLVTYIKNMTPVLAQMTREVDAREKELTNPTSRERLCEHLDQVKTLIPSFISSIKVVLTLNPSIDTIDKQIMYFAFENKDFLIKQLIYEINEIIKILKLTSYDQNYLAFEEFNQILKNEINNFESNSNTVIKWLSNQNSMNDSSAEKTMHDALENCSSIMSKLDQTEHKKLYDLYKKCEILFSDLLASEKNQKSEILKSSGDALCNQLNEIMIYLKKMNFEPGDNFSCISFYEQLELSAKWLSNPSRDDSQIGELTARSIIQEAKKLISKESHFDDRQNFEKFIYQCEYMIDEFKQFSKDIKLDRITIKNAAKQLQNSLSFIVKRIYRLLIQKIADQYSDLNAPLNKLVETVHKSNGDQITDDKFDEFSIEFLERSHKLCDISTGLALSTNQIQSRNSIDLINRLTLRIKEISPHIVNAGYITIKFPGDRNFLENFELLQRQWQTNIFYLQQLVDEIIDCESFIIACEKSIIRETYETQDAVLEKNTSVIVNNALSIAQKTNRIVKVTAQEAENSEDKLFVDKILQSNDKLKQSLPYFIHSAKSLALDPSDKENYLIWASSNEQLIDAIASVRECVSNNDLESNRYSIPNDQDLNSQLSQLNYLRINEDFNNNSYVPKYKPLPVSRPTPLPDLIEENENEFPEPQNNQPILMAAHDLHYSINQWYTTDNDMVAVAKRITFLMAKLSELVRGQNRSNKQLISTAKQLFDESLEICRLARLMANDCTDKRMKINLLQVCERIPTIGTQLKILSTVKATMLGHQAKTNQSERIYGSREDEEATEMLIINAQNLNASVKETIRAAKSASIKLKSGSALKFKWIRKKSVESNILSVI